MNTKIQNQIDIINETLNWIKINKQEQYESRFFQLIEKRYELYKIQDAIKENPAIAAYGESQKGKSYLIGNLLQNSANPFEISVGEESYNFVNKINPIGDNREATGVVTRFTSFTRTGDNRYSSKYPVMMKLFSISDLVCVLCDGYYNDVQDSQTESDDKIKEFSNKLYNDYINKADTKDKIKLTEDDIWQIKSYIEKFISHNTRGLRESNFFNNLALVIKKIPSNELIDILSYLWNRNQEITNLFTKLVKVIESLQFNKYIYLNIDAVLHKGDNKNTIMSVDCLNGLDGETTQTNVYIKKSDDTFEELKNFNKCDLSALCAETIFKVEEKYLSEKVNFCFDNIHDEVAQLLNRNDGFNKDLMRKMDLLDFPGARNRLQVKTEFLSDNNDNNNDNNGASNLVQILLRGKVSFLFNKYSSSKLINILLFCHDHGNPSVNSMYSTINNWVEEYVGKNTDKRKKTIESTNGVSPLFIIATKFNIDMTLNRVEEHNNDAAIDQRWEGRFTKVLYTQSLKGDNVNWFNNWIGDGITFKNTYLLRDFKYSACNGNGNHLYKGYEEKNDGKEEELVLPQEYYDRMRNSFINSQDTAKFFENAAMAWDLAASINNDGSLYIIYHLTKAANKIEATREMQLNNVIDNIRLEIKSIIDDYYIVDDNGVMIKQNIIKTKHITRELDFACRKDNYFFGHLIQILQVKLKNVYSVTHKILSNTNIINDVTSFENYEILSNRCKMFLGCNNEEDILNKICTVYAYNSTEEAIKSLNSEGIDYRKLLHKEYKPKQNSSVIAEQIIEKWFEKLNEPSLINTICKKNNVNENIIHQLIEMIITSAKYYKLQEEIENTISDIVNITNVNIINKNLVTDLIKEKINYFVNNLGYNFLNKEQLDNIDNIAKEHDLELEPANDERENITQSQETLTEFFNNNNNNNIASFWGNYNKWIYYMSISLISTIGAIQNYDRAANEELYKIKERL